MPAVAADRDLESRAEFPRALRRMRVERNSAGKYAWEALPRIHASRETHRATRSNALSGSELWPRRIRIRRPEKFPNDAFGGCISFQSMERSSGREPRHNWRDQASSLWFASQATGARRE